MNIWTGLFMVFCIAVGFAMLYGLMRYLQRAEDGEEYERQVNTSRTVRSHKRQRLLYEIGQPECEIPLPNGHKANVLSPRQQELWAEYKRLESEEREMVRAEDDELIRRGR